MVCSVWFAFVIQLLKGYIDMIKVISQSSATVLATKNADERFFIMNAEVGE